MASPLFCHSLLDDLGFEVLFGVHLLEPTAYLLKLPESSHQGRVHTSELGAPLVEHRNADVVLSAQFRRRTTGFALLEDGDDLAA